MAKSFQPKISFRKQSQQSRSNELVNIILEAAHLVLIKEGIARFTTARVAERAGVSIGSIYQYFPNKAAILFRLQADEWQQTNDRLQGIIENKHQPALERLERLIRTFIESEFEEALIRMALENEAPFYHKEPEATQAHTLGQININNFIKELLPHSSNDHQIIVSDILMMTLSSMGKNLSIESYNETQVSTYVSVVYTMFSHYIMSLSKSS